MRFLLFFCLSILYHFSFSQNLDHFVVGTDGGFAGNNLFENPSDLYNFILNN